MNDGVLSLEASRPADLALVCTPLCASFYESCGPVLYLHYGLTTGIRFVRDSRWFGSRILILQVRIGYQLVCVLDNPATRDIHSRSLRWYWSMRAGSFPCHPGQAPPYVEGARAGGRKQHPRKARQWRAGHHPAQDRQGARVLKSTPCTPPLDACMPCAAMPPTIPSSACLLPPAVDLLTYFCGGD